MKGERQVDMRPVCIALGYLYGSFLTADLVVRAKTGKHRWDSFGNPGTANVASRLGTRYGIIVLCGDILKTVLACICGLLLLPGPERLGVLYAGFGAVIGHCWPVWKGFRGGKGIACAGTAAVLFSPAIGFGALIGGAAAVLVLSLIHISEPTRQAEISYAVFCLKKKKKITYKHQFAIIMKKIKDK